MSTAGQMVDQTLLQLNGYSSLQDQSTPLTVATDNAVTTITVSDVSQLSRGLAEIESEIVYVESVDAPSNTAVVVRGYRSTTATSHGIGARAVMSPLFYRSTVLQALNDTIGAVWPGLFATGTTTFTTNGTQTTYPLPIGTVGVLDVKWRNVGPTQEWSPVRRWDVDNTANTTYFPTGATITVWDGIPSGRTVQVVCSSAPTSLAAESNLFSATGLPPTCEDVIRLGAMWRLIPFLDTPHYAMQSAEADFAGQNRPVGGAMSASRYYLQLYQVRLQEETSRLNNLYSVRVHYTI